MRRLERHGAVLVQGPPGTGKSHTIANLIGHLLAQGKSVLVTSHTTKALRVLRGHVVDQLRPLCVSVLESDSDSRDQLRDCVQGISTRLSQADHGQLLLEAEKLEAERNELIDKLEQVRSQLRNAVEGEYRSIVVAGKEFSPSDAAKNVAAGIGIHDWIPGPVHLGGRCRFRATRCTSSTPQTVQLVRMTTTTSTSSCHHLTSFLGQKHFQLGL